MTPRRDARRVEPLPWPCDADLTLPGSKSEANRILAAAALGGRPVTVRGATPCDDVLRMADGLRVLGYAVEWLDLGSGTVRVGPRAPDPPSRGELACGNAGTALRFLVSLAALTPGDWVVTGDARMQRRPIGPLVDAWRQLGLEVAATGGCPPVRVRGGAAAGGRVHLDPSVSSQYLSSLLLAGSALRHGMDITFDAPLASAKYAKWTCDVLAAFGVKTELGPRGARVHRGRGDSPAALDVSGDWSAMGVWTCLGFLTGSRVRGVNLRRDSGQADEALVRILTPLAGAGDREVDVEPLPDQFMNLAVVAAHRQGRTRLTGAANLRVKECDRIAVTARELRRLGVPCDERPDGVDIEGVKALRPAVVDPEGDHRVAIAFALAGLLAPGIEIADAACVSKSYPTFWDDVELVRASTRCVAVAGMRGAGKSTFARALAARTGREWLDIDQAFERARGPIDAFVKTHGWDAFRAEEARLVESALAPGRVVSLGGGAVESAATRARLRERAVVVWLDARAALLRERIPEESASRPSVTGAEVRAELETLLTKRRPLYAEVSSLRVPAELDTEAQVGLALSSLARPCRFPGAGLERPEAGPGGGPPLPRGM